MIDLRVGDLVMDKDVFGDCIDIALVLETPESRRGGYYRVYYCTGPTAGDIVLETVHAMANFKVISEGGKRDA